MGIEITSEHFAPDAVPRFSQKLEHNLSALKRLIQQSHFGRGPQSLGAELELYIVDDQGQCALLNEQLLKEAADPKLTLELNRYNLEYNLAPFDLSDQPFSQTEQQMVNCLQKLNDLAALHQARVVPIGILPTLRPQDLEPQVITARKRYQALIQQLRSLRQAPYQIDIRGQDHFKLATENIAFEGSNTSFQIHYRVATEDFVDTYNAFQLVTPLVMAVAANSPFLLGHSLWQETRIPLFKQSIDCRQLGAQEWHPSARVHFGHGWVRQSASEVFEEAVRLFQPLIPICGEDDPLEQMQSGKTPSLEELRLHLGTTWTWNRPVFDHHDNGHLRIELRALPSGPTPIDMVANAAFYIGLAEGVKARINDLLPSLPFALAEHNFYRSAQFGLDANLVWPSQTQCKLQERPVRELLEEYLEIAQQGLGQIGLADEGRRYLQVIEDRLNRGINGAIWQRQQVQACEQHDGRQQALHRMLERYIVAAHSNTPLASW